MAMSLVAAQKVHFQLIAAQAQLHMCEWLAAHETVYRSAPLIPT